MASIRQAGVVWAAIAASAVIGGPAARAEVFQYAIDFDYAARDQPQTGRAWLWIPPDAERIRGVVLAGQTSAEKPFVQDPHIRRACAEQQLAIIYLDTGLGAVDVSALLKAFAAKSGYDELAGAALLFFGHSAGGPQAQQLAGRFADRCFGLIQHRGGVARGVPPGVPALASVGQFDEFGGVMREADGREPAWQNAHDEIVVLRRADPTRPLSIIVEPGAGHFTWSPRTAAFVARWIAAAAEARIPADPAEPDAVVKCRPIDAASGWLSAADPRDRAHPAAPADGYTGEPAQASWYFTEALARAADAYHAPFGRSDQFIAWQDRCWVDAGVRYFFLDIAWDDDGRTAIVHPVYRQTYPEQPNGQGPKWLRAGQPVGHCDAPIALRVVGGPIVAVGGQKLRLAYDALNPAGRRARPTFVAYSEGDATYRYTEQVGMLSRGFEGFTKGRDQSITFPPLADVNADAAPIDLHATSDAGLPVDCYIDYGPARVVDGQLIIADLPARATLPIEVKVTAYQFGRAVDPQVKTAPPVSQVFRIVR